MVQGQNKHYSEAVKKNNYDDSFESVMTYFDTNLPTTKIKNKNDLQRIFDDLNAQEEKKSKKGRFSNKFIREMVSRFGKSKKYNKGNQTTLGNEKMTKRQEKEKEYISQGREVYVYRTHRNPYDEYGKKRSNYEINRGAVKTTFKNKNGKVIMQFRDIETGRFISKEQKDTLEEIPN